MHRGLAFLVVGALASCSTTASPTTSSALPTTTTVQSPTTTSIPATSSFELAVGPDGITYDLEGSPPAGPSSFTITPNGTVVVADTMAAGWGEPRLIAHGPDGTEQVVALDHLEVESVVDIVALGDLLVVLDVDVARDRYRVLSLVGSDLVDEVEVPVGSRFADGLTGLAVDDGGWLLEFEFGGWFERLASSGAERVDSLVLGGVPVEVAPAARGDTVLVGDQRLEVSRSTELGGTFFVGLAGDGTVVVVVDEVTVGDSGIVVDRQVRRYGADGGLIGWVDIDLTQETVHVARPVEMAPDGSWVYLFAEPNQLVVEVFDV